MKQIGRMGFPETPEEAKAWEPVSFAHPLHMNVLAVAKTRIEGTWKAYIAVVPGMDHDLEETEVLRNGAPLGESIASVLFPQFEDVPYAR